MLCDIRLYINNYDAIGYIRKTRYDCLLAEKRTVLVLAEKRAVLVFQNRIHMEILGRMWHMRKPINTYAHFGSGMPQSAQNLLAGWFRRCSSLSLALDGSASVKHWKWSISIPLKQTKQIALTDIGKYIITGHEQSNTGEK